MKIVLEGERFRLRTLVRADAETVNKYASRPAIARYTLIPRPYPRNGARDFIRKCHNEARNGTGMTLAIELKTTGEIIGLVALGQINKQSKKAELGYWLAEEYWGKGYMSEAVRLLVKYGFRKIKLVRIYARVMHPNVASAKLLERVGFTYEGRMRKMVFKNGRWLDELWYGMLKEEFKA
jgi:RimJ/RimL family protein N-acetyltransferase